MYEFRRPNYYGPPVRGNYGFSNPAYRFNRFNQYGSSNQNNNGPKFNQYGMNNQTGNPDRVFNNNNKPNTQTIFNRYPK